MTTPADLVFINGAVFRSNASRSWATGVAVTGERIVAVGSTDTVGVHMGPDTEVVDLDGRMLCAGFQDAHVHPASGGLRLGRCDVSNCDDAAAAQAEIAAYSDLHRDVPWIRGGGWRYDWFPSGTPSAELLDLLIPDRPAYLVVTDGHSAWVNTRALEVAGITATTPDPADGRIERLAGGQPQGTLHEGAMSLMAAVLPADTEAEIDAAILAGQAYLHSFGVTAWQDAWVTTELHEAYVRLATDGRLRSRVRGALWWDRAGDLSQLDAMDHMRSESVGPYVAGTVKLMLDGVCENFTASLLQPYLDHAGRPTRNSGIDMIDRRELPAIVSEVVARGFQPHFHAIGDAAVRSALDAVETASHSHPLIEIRPHVAHIQIIDSADIPRFRRLGVAANAQPLWACHDAAQDDMTIPFIGPDRAALQYPFAGLLRHGATLAMGSDWSVSTPDVMAQIHVAIHRQTAGPEPLAPFLPDQRITLADALTAFTAGSAHVNHLDEERGTIDAGKIADLVVLDRNPFETEEVWRTRVDVTIVGGEVVFRRES